MQRILLEIISVDFDAIDHTFCIHQIFEEKHEYTETVHQLFIDFKKAYDSVRREVLYNILIEFGIPMKQAELIKIFLNKTYSRVQVDKHLPDMFPIKNSLK
jgi:hypothetical protein